MSLTIVTRTFHLKGKFVLAYVALVFDFDGIKAPCGKQFPHSVSVSHVDWQWYLSHYVASLGPLHNWEELVVGNKDLIFYMWSIWFEMLAVLGTNLFVYKMTFDFKRILRHLWSSGSWACLWLHAIVFTFNLGSAIEPVLCNGNSWWKLLKHQVSHITYRLQSLEIWPCSLGLKIAERFLNRWLIYWLMLPDFQEIVAIFVFPCV